MSQRTTLAFYGATGTVTGSKYLVRHRGRTILIDCGLFQGFKALRERNWSPPPLSPSEVDTVLLTHAHIDHSGYLPLLIRQGFRGPVHCTPATEELCALLLPDSGHLHELDAEYANRRGYSRHHPALPLYTEQEGREALSSFAPVDFDTPLDLGEGLTATFVPAGHILGAASIHLRWPGGSVLFSGDLGRPNDLMMRPPRPRLPTDHLVVESTYGDRLHPEEDTAQVVVDLVHRTLERGGKILVPAFAVGRSQTLLLMLDRLARAGRIPRLPVYLDSPMAIAATSVYFRHRATHRLDDEECERVGNSATMVRSVETSKELDQREDPMIVIAASGMATGGRVVHHLKHWLPDARNTVLFAGYQAPGTRGGRLVEGERAVKIHGQYVPVRAEVTDLETFSAHADANEIMAWLRSSDRRPKLTHITHGEDAARDALRLRIEEELGWRVNVPDYRDVVEL